MAKKTSEPDWRRVVGALPGALFVLSPEGHILQANAAALQLSGREMQALEGRSISQLFDAAEGTFEQDELPVVRAGVSVERERTLVRSDGVRLPVLLSAAALSEAAPDDALVVCQCIDITERKAAEEEVIRGRANLRAVIDNADQTIFSLDGKGRLVSFNRIFAEYLVGWTGIVAEPGLDLKRLLPVELQPVARAHLDRAAQGMAFTVEHPIRSADEDRLVAISLNPVREQPGGVVVGVAVYARDVTQERLYAERLRKARDEAEAAASARALFLATMSHEIRTPLNGVIGMADLLAGTSLTAEQAEYVSTIRGSSDLLTGVLNDVLDLSRLDAGGLVLDARPIWIPEVLETLVAVYSAEARRKGLDLRLTLDPALRREERLGDALRIRQVVGNLLSNAVKFCEQGQVEVRATGVASEAAPWTVRFEVRDTGIGIRPENLDRLFEPFVQGDPSTTRRFGGSGLGLSIARRLVDLMGGRLSVESVPGRGSVFRADLSLPVSGAHVDDRAPAVEMNRDIPAEEKGEGASARPPTPEDAALRVLVAEDNAVNRLVANRLLRATGIEADLVENGLEALEAIARGDFDVVFLDIEMPEMDGLEVARRVKGQLRGRCPYLVAMTAHAAQGYESVSREAGMDDYLAKPVRPRDLADVLSRYREARGMNG